MALLWQVPLAIVWIAGWVLTIRLLNRCCPDFQVRKDDIVFGEIAHDGLTIFLIVLWPLALALVFLRGFYNWVVEEEVL